MDLSIIDFKKFTYHDFEILTAAAMSRNRSIGEPTNGFAPEKLERLKEVLVSLRHHDEFYTILDMRNLELEWVFGFEHSLGYDSNSRKFYNSFEIIHPNHRKLFILCGQIAYELFHLKDNLPQEPLAGRYIINIPVEKSNGKFLWVKQMSMPLNTDKNGRMVRQLNSYMIIGRYEEMALPLAPRIFNTDGSRLIELEQKLLLTLKELTGLNLTEIQELMLKTRCQLEKEKQQLDFHAPKQVTHQDVFDKLKSIPMSSIKKESSNIKTIAQKALGVRFRDVHQVARFFSPLYQPTD